MNDSERTTDMSTDFTVSDLDSLGKFNLSVNLTGPLQFGTELDILFQPENVLIALYVPVILLSLVTNVLLIIVAVKCNYTKK